MDRPRVSTTGAAEGDPDQPATDREVPEDASLGAHGAAFVVRMVMQARGVHWCRTFFVRGPLEPVRTHAGLPRAIGPTAPELEGAQKKVRNLPRLRSLRRSHSGGVVLLTVSCTQSEMLVRLIPFVAMVALALPPQDPAAPELPDKTRESLEEKWKDWTPAAVDPQAVACLKNGVAPAGPLVVDLDSDGHQDFVLTVQTATGVRLVAVLYRLPDFVVHDLDEGAGGFPTLAPRGAKFMPAGGTDDYFPAQTIVVRRCGQPDVAYLWTGFSFRKTPLAPGTTPPPPTR